MRRLRRILLLLVTLFVVLNLAGGYYYATQINAGALKVDPWTPEAVNEVTNIGANQITIAEGTDDAQNQSLASQGTYGVEWDGGYGQITGAPEIDGKQVTKSFEVLVGTLPEEGTEVSIALFAFQGTPPEGAELTTYDAPLGETGAVFAPGDQDVWAIFVHGRGGTVAEGYRTMQTTQALGLPTLDIAYRNDQGQPADPSAKYWFGDTEWADLDAAVEHARDEGAKGVVLIGSSMGGAIVASYLRHTEDPDFVRGVVLDSPALSLERTVEYGADQVALPAGLKLPPTITWTAKRIASLRYHVPWQETDYLTDTNWVTAPVLLFHGADDVTVPVATSREFAERAPDVTYVELPDTGHIRAWNTNPDAYDQNLRDFLEPLLSQ